MVVASNTKEGQKSMSDSNVNVYPLPHRNSTLPPDNHKESSTFSGQYNGRTSSNIPNINNVNPQWPNNIPYPHNYQQYDNPPCTCPPQPYPPQDDLWDLQFCRWWGWNWVRKRDEIVNRQNRPCGRRLQTGPSTRKARKRNPKQDDFFSWCNKLFKGRQKECPLKIQEKEQLQEMYDTPSIMSLNKCCQPSAPNWDCRSINLHRTKCYCNNGKSASVSTLCIKNKTRREVDKCNRRKNRSWVCEKCESSSSEEGCLHVCQCPKSPLSSTSESVEYLALRMECLNSDNDDNICRYQKQLKCCQQICPSQFKRKRLRNVCPCKFKVICERKEEPCSRRVKECNKISDPYQSQFAQWKCTCGRCCTCVKDAPVRYPQFCRLNQRCKYVPELQNSKRKEYIIRCPLVHSKKNKTCFPCCCCRLKCADCECKLNIPKLMVDKCVSCPDVKVNHAQILQENYQKERIPQVYKNIATNSFQESMISDLKNGQFPSPVSGKVYGLSPCFINDSPLSNRTNFPNPIDIHEPFLSFSNNTSEVPFAEKEHNIILTAVCEAIMSSHLSDQDSDKIVEEDTVLNDYNYLFTDKCQELLNPFQNSSDNFINKVESYAHKRVDPTDKFVGYHTKKGKPYETIPLRSIKKTCIAGSRIPLLKKKHSNSNFGNRERSNINIYDITDTSNFEMSNNLATVINNKCEIDSSFNSKEKIYLKPEKCGNIEDSLSGNSISFRSPWSLIRPSKLPGISMSGLFSKLSNTFINNNDKNEKKILHGSATIPIGDSLKFYSKNIMSHSNTIPTETSPYSPSYTLLQDTKCTGFRGNNVENRNRIWNETLSTCAVQSGSNLTSQFRPISACSTLDNFSNNNFNVFNLTPNNEMQSDPINRITSSVDINYIENIIERNSSIFQNIQIPKSFSNMVSPKNKYIMASNLLHKEELFNKGSQNLFFDLSTESYRESDSCAKSEPTSSTNLINSKDVTRMTGTKKSRIPIHDTNLRDKLLPIVEEHNGVSHQTDTKLESKRPTCSKKKEN